MRRSLINLRKNPDIAKHLPEKQIVYNDGKINKKQMLLVCGYGSEGALGLKRYYLPGRDDPDNVRGKDSGSSTFKRLASYEGKDRLLDVSCGHGFSVMVAKSESSSHSAFGFGLNQYSQLGYQANRPGYPLELVATPGPIVVPTNEPIISASCGRAHTLLLNKSGQVFSLGLNSLGQCGRPINEKEDYFGSRRVWSFDGSLPSDIIAIESGQDHSLFLSKSGKVYSCGWGADGQTGLGHYDTIHEPTRVKGDIKNVKIVKLSSCCDTVLALDDEGNVFGWGNSEYAQFKSVALSDEKQFSVPRLLRMGNIPGKIIDIAAGGTICAILNNKGQVFVWGYGILGQGPKVDQASEPSLIPESLFGMNVYNLEVKVTSIYAGLSHFGAITNQGDLFMWGKNRARSLGFPHGLDQYFPMRVNVDLCHVRKISLGLDHTAAIVEKVT